MKINVNKDWRLPLLIFFCGFSTILILFLILKFSSHGIDFTDEGYYLNWFSNPFLYKVSLSQFGFIYHPIYNLVDENIVSLRRVNFLITFGFSTILVYLLFCRLTNFEKLNKIILSCGIAITSFTYLYIQTPSYNHLTLQGLLITCIGVLLISNINLNKNILAYIVIGFGGWLTFMAKPSSAIGLGLLIIIYLSISQKFKFRFLLISIITSFLLILISAIIIDGSITKFFYRYRLSYDISKLLQSGYDINSIIRLGSLNLSLKIKQSILFIFILSILLACLEYFNSKFFKIISIIFSFSLFLFIFILSLFEITWNPNYGYYQPYQIFGTVFACMVICLLFLLQKKIKIKDICWDLVFLFLLLPYISAIGTNNNYWMQSGIASIFWLLIGLVFLIPISLKIKKIEIVFIFVIISQVITSLHIKEKNEDPYRNNEPLRLSNAKISTNYKNHTIFISDEFAKYVQDARNIAEQSGFKKGNSIIDLSGRSPGLLYLMEAKSIGTAWNMGGYKGSLDVAKSKYDLVNCSDLASAWVIYEINNSRGISTDLFKNFGINFPSQYQLVGSWEIPKGAGGYMKNRVQKLYKPYNSKNMNISCEEFRKINK